MLQPPPAPETPPVSRAGLAQGVAAYALWGLLPLYFALLRGVDAGEIVATRILWSLVLLAVLIAALRRWPRLRVAMASPRTLLMLSASALLIAVNWLVYIWAVLNHHVLEGSLGYFLNPLINVLLGVLVLRERLDRVQAAAVGLAALGVLVLAVGAGAGLWISLVLAVSFGLYGLVRKLAPVDSIEGLTIETAILAPVAGLYLLWLGERVAFGEELTLSLLLALAGVVTAVPLLLFAAAAKRLRYSTLGLLQYLAPTMQFLLAIFVFGEHMTRAHLVCFVLIWSGLALYAGRGTWEARRRRLPA
ncbi:EamA family transporter RarD [Sphingosinithalassobacter sp. CS137]|uniref:EamA family transporter RarD n=1 Tax=Sphingosinithalassobacter sp. CS137 TaxID=2762748 RepID=UPI00165EA724|nr:EamA family transporter RarD [Sphingosinithalassobacter sp. CS137]